MDTSKKYIEMCEKANEIQKPVSELKDGDFISDFRFIKNEVVVYHPLIHNKEFGENGIEDEFTWWLPRQDQLQDMLKYSVWFEKLYRFYDWLQEENNSGEWVSGCNKFDSMEQLWLAFIMKEKYNKTWNGEKWIIKDQ